jgi:thioredoxin-like negative regulator of GroEL
VSLANRMAIASPHITASAVEANEFPRLSAQFGVRSVPRTVVNRAGAFVGALPEQDFVGATLQLAGVALEELPEQPPGASTDLAG